MEPIWGDQTMEMHGHSQGFPLFNSALVWVGTETAVTPEAYLLEGRCCISHVETELKVVSVWPLSFPKPCAISPNALVYCMQIRAPHPETVECWLQSSRFQF